MSRIVAGRAGGRRLETPDGQTTRPTADRVREAFFSVLASWNGTADLPVEDQLADLAFCDLYAGSGAVGLEAASRGASPVLLVEAHARAAQVIARNISSTGLAAQCRTAKVETVVATSAARPFDVVWLDPPYAVDADALDAVLAGLLAHGWVRTDGVVVVERAGRTRAPALAGCEHWTRDYGETTLHWFAPQAEPAQEDQSVEPAQDGPQPEKAVTTEENPA